MQDLVGKVAVVTGAASGIGRALAERFADEEMRVVLSDIEAVPLQAAVAALRARSRAVDGVVADVSRADSVAALAAEVRARYGNVHVLCNNAGVLGGSTGPIWDATVNDWQWMLGVNLWGVIHGLREFLPAMLAHGEAGHVVNTASTTGLVTGENVYSVTKHAVVALSEGVYVGLQRQGARIGCSVLCPTFIATRVRAAERNRPLELANPGTQIPVDGPSRYARFERTPAFIAQAVVDAIRADQFYVNPSAELDPFVESRMTNLLARTNPSPEGWNTLLAGNP
jgi:NAD(P)-dependent dehydrogenase (short-subunit alcohol dehydrogenase family)